MKVIIQSSCDENPKKVKSACIWMDVELHWIALVVVVAVAAAHKLDLFG